MKQLLQDPTVGKQQNWDMARLSEARFHVHIKSPFSAYQVLWKLQWLNVNNWYICLLLQFIPSTLQKQIFRKTFQEKGDTINLSFPASLMLILAFLRMVKSFSQAVWIRLRV